MLNEKLLKSRTGGFLSEASLAGLEFDANGIPELDEFTLDMIPLDSTIVNFGKRRTGKSTLTRYLCYHYFRYFFPRGIVISHTEHLNKAYSKFVPKKYIHNELSEKLQQDILDFQESVKSDARYEDWLAEDENFNRCFVIYDDVINDENAIRYSKPLRTMFTNGRHYDVMPIINTQYVHAIPPTMRANVDVAFMFTATDMPTKEHLFQCFGDMLPRQLFMALHEKYTMNYKVLVYYNGDANNKSIRGKFYWFLADPNTPDFRMGTPAYWGEESGDQRDQGFDQAVEQTVGQ